MSDHNQQLGRSGEQLARLYLERKGYVWLASNYRTRWGEIDLVMRHKARYVFVEVKRRRNDHYGTPEEAVHKTKRNHMVMGALGYLQELKLIDQMIQFDVVSLGPSGLRHFPNAFYAGGEYYY